MYDKAFRFSSRTPLGYLLMSRTVNNYNYYNKGSKIKDHLKLSRITKSVQKILVFLSIKLVVLLN